MTPADGGAAFPSQLREARDPGDHDPQGGMSLRDWFAGQALAGMTANKVTLAASDARRIPELAFAFADAMVAERAK
jgi:hypothetical protein